MLQVVGDVAVDYALSETFDDGGLADTWFTNEDGVVLGSPRQNPHNSADLFLSANDRVDLLVSGHGGHVDCELGQVLVFLLGVGSLAIDALGSSDGRDGILDELGLGDVGFPQSRLNVAVLGQRGDEVVDTYVSVLLDLLQLHRLSQDAVEGW